MLVGRIWLVLTHPLCSKQVGDCGLFGSAGEELLENAKKNKEGTPNMQHRFHSNICNKKLLNPFIFDRMVD